MTTARTLTQRRAANTLATLCAVFIAACVVAAVVAARAAGATW